MKAVCLRILSFSASHTHTHTYTHTKLHTMSLFPNSLTPPLHTHNFSSLEKLNGVKLSVSPSVSRVFGRDENDSEERENMGSKTGRRKKERRDLGQGH